MGFALKNILRRRLRTALTLSGVALGITAFVALVGFSRSFEQEWLKIYEGSGTDLVVVRGTFLNTSLDESLGAKLRSLPEVVDAVPNVMNIMDLTPEINAVIYGWLDDSFDLDPMVILSGRRFRGEGAEIMLGEVLAESLNKKTGDTLEIQGTPFEVVAVFRGRSAIETGGAVMPLRQLQRLSDLGDKVTSFRVRVRSRSAADPAPEEVRRARLRIEADFPGLRAVPAGDMARNHQVVVLARATAWGTSAIALFIGALGIANTMAMSVFERTREIGVLRALGWRCGRIMRLILLEAAMLGCAGGVLGVAGGWLALHVLASIRATANIAQSSIPAWQALQAVALAIGIGLAAGLLPAYRGARLSPVEALRYE